MEKNHKMMRIKCRIEESVETVEKLNLSEGKKNISSVRFLPTIQQM